MWRYWRNRASTPRCLLHRSRTTTSALNWSIDTPWSTIWQEVSQLRTIASQTSKKPGLKKGRTRRCVIGSIRRQMRSSLRCTFQPITAIRSWFGLWSRKCMLTFNWKMSMVQMCCILQPRETSAAPCTTLWTWRICISMSKIIGAVHPCTGPSTQRLNTPCLTLWPWNLTWK